MILDLNRALDDHDVQEDDCSKALTFWYAFPVFLYYTSC